MVVVVVVVAAAAAGGDGGGGGDTQSAELASSMLELPTITPGFAGISHHSS